jgi:hypothetical protein
MWSRAASALCIATLCGCANSGAPTPNPFEVFDPAAFDPIEKSAPDYNLFSYRDLGDARTKLYELARSYAIHRDNVRQGTLILDAPLVGLAITGVVAAANHFASTTTLGMLAGSGGLLGVRAYLDPTTKAKAYQNAESGLQCLAITATDLDRVNQSDAALLLDALNGARHSPPLPPQSQADAAAKAAVDLSTALSTLTTSSVTQQLSSAAQTIVQKCYEAGAYWPTRHKGDYTGGSE